jgi:hypothetical protein
VAGRARGRDRSVPPARAPSSRRLTLETAVGRTRAGHDAVCWQGATTPRDLAPRHRCPVASRLRQAQPERDAGSVAKKNPTPPPIALSLSKGLAPRHRCPFASRASTGSARTGRNAWRGKSSPTPDRPEPVEGSRATPPLPFREQGFDRLSPNGTREA